MGDGVLDGVAGDLVEGNAADGDALQRIFLREHGANMPGDRFSLTVGIGGQVKRLGTLQRLGDGTDLLVAADVGFPVHGEILVRPDASILGWKVTHMPETGQDGVTATKVAVDGLSLGGGLDDDNV